MFTSRAVHTALLAIVLCTGATSDRTPEPMEAPSVVEPASDRHVPPAAPAVTTPTTPKGYEGDDERLAWVMEQFAAGGLTVTDVDVRFYSDPIPCRGNRGLHTREDGVNVVSVCGSPASGRKRTLLHEVSHAWVAQNVSDQLRDEFMDLRGVAVWNDHDVDWEERGTEHAAEIVVWGIGDHPCWHTPAAALAKRSSDELTEAFELLTGIEPRCDADAPEPRAASAAQILS